MRKVSIWCAAILVAGAAAGCGSKAKEPKTTPKVTERKPEPKPEPEPEVEEPKVAVDERVNLTGPIYFEFDRSDLTDDARGKLENNFEWLKKNPSSTLTIEGHTDEVGTTEYNLGLGERRARAARDYLVRMGADGKRLKVISYGEERPAQSGNDPVNRRDEFKE